VTKREVRQREVEVAEDASFDLNLGAVAVLFPMVDQSVSIVVMHAYMVQSHAAVYMMVSLSTTTIFLSQKCHITPSMSRDPQLPTSISSLLCLLLTLSSGSIF